jgi:hypothetical protein
MAYRVSLVGACVGALVGGAVARPAAIHRSSAGGGATP